MVRLSSLHLILSAVNQVQSLRLTHSIVKLRAPSSERRQSSLEPWICASFLIETFMLASYLTQGITKLSAPSPARGPQSPELLLPFLASV